VLGKNTRGEGIIEVNGVPLSKVDTAQLFAEFFQKKVAKLSNTAIQPCRLPNPNIPIILKKEEVFDALNKMKPEMSSGLNGIPQFIIKTHASTLGDSLAKIFNKMAREGIPDALKIS